MRALAAAALAAAVVASGAGPAGAQSPSAARRSLRNSLSRTLRTIGGAGSAYVVDLSTGRALFASSATTGRLPASVEKLYTTSTVLLRFGPRATLKTSVLGKGSLQGGGVWHGALYLRGGGDPTFGTAGFDRAAYGTGATVQRLVGSLVRATGITAIHGRVVGDESYFDSLRGTAPYGYRANTDTEGQLSALVFDRGFTNLSESTFQRRPALFAAQQFAAALQAAHIAVPGRTLMYTGRTPASARPLATVSSPPISALLRLTLTPSDNFFAEMLLKGLGARYGGAGTTAAGALVVRQELAAHFGLHPRVVDGSGLSREDLTSPHDVVSLLGKMASNATFVNALAVMGETGTLENLDRGTFAQGRCRGKTGTLTDVANLAGYCRAADGHTLAFAFLMNSVADPGSVHEHEAAMAVAVARYGG